MYLMMDIEISCKGHCGSFFPHFLDLVSETVYTQKRSVPCILIPYISHSLIDFGQFMFSGGSENLSAVM